MKRNWFNYILTIITFVIFILHISSLIAYWSDIPRTIAIHYSGVTPDGWGPKYLLFILPTLSILTWWLIGLPIKRPEKLNLINLTEKNKQIQIARVKKVMHLLQNLSVISFILFNEAMLRGAMGLEYMIPFYTAIILILICLIVPIYQLFWSATLKY